MVATITAFCALFLFISGVGGDISGVGTFISRQIHINMKIIILIPSVSYTSMMTSYNP